MNFLKHSPTTWQEAGVKIMAMGIRLWRIKYAMKLVFVLNLAFVTFLFLRTENIAEKHDYTILFRRARQRLPWNLASGNVNDNVNICTKSILLFGMKQHWEEYCRFSVMSRFRHLVKFPRIFNCPNLKCQGRIFYSESIRDINKADIVLFTNVYKWLTQDMWSWAHGNRSDHQPWVLVSVDSPMYVPGLKPPDQFLDTTYNLIASYKEDSDVHLPYGLYQPYSKDESLQSNIDLKVFLKNKKGLISWISSNCNTFQWDRRRLVRDINAILDVNIYGKCGNNQQIPWNDRNATESVLGRHKFYLSLENSCCRDYISGRFWRALEAGTVPIVVGASLEDYNRVAPPNSFIHVDQFESLAAMLIHVTLTSNDDERYLQYFQWRKKGRIKVIGQGDQYVAPLKNETHCSILEKYLQYNGTAAERRVTYMGKRWLGSCKNCGDKWINDYMLPT